MAAATNLTGPQLAQALRELADLVQDGEAQLSNDFAGQLTKEAHAARARAAGARVMKAHESILAALAK